MKLTRRKKILAAFLLVLAVLIGPYLFSRMLSPWRRVRVFSDNVEAVGHEGATLRVVCYNIAHGRGATDDNWEEFGEEKAAQVTEIGKFLKETDADIVVLNEVDFCAVWSGHRNQAEAIARESGFPYRAEQRNLDFRLIYGSCKFGNAVLSRYPIVDAEVVNYPAQSSWEDWLAGSKRGVVCTIRLSPGRQIRVVAVHLEHRDETTRVASANMILDAVRSSEIPLIRRRFQFDTDRVSALAGQPERRERHGQPRRLRPVPDASPRIAESGRANLLVISTEKRNRLDTYSQPVEVRRIPLGRHSALRPPACGCGCGDGVTEVEGLRQLKGVHWSGQGSLRATD